MTTLLGPGTLRNLLREVDDGAVVYELEWTDGGPKSAKITEAGVVVVQEAEIDPATLPAAVVAAITARYPRGERRWLLSAPAAASPSDAPPRGPVELVEVEPAEEGDDGDVAVDYADLPRAVTKAFEALYPGANVLASEFGAADGEDGEHDITAESGGRVVDVTLAPDGEILEVEHTVDSAELPREVLDWCGTASPAPRSAR